jgi:aryl-alcohol dehydrogenase-like predicted oxidoreductase
VLGTAGLGGAWSPVDPAESVTTILRALESGITRLDTAPAYAQAEKIVGEALRRWNGPPPFVSTKVGKLEGDALAENLNNYDLAVMEQSVRQSLERLGCTMLDLLFLHEPEKVPAQQVEAVVEFMLEQKQTGRAQAIGFGGTPPQAYHPYIEAGGFDVVMGYNNLDAANLDALQSDIPFFKKHGLATYQGSALHMGLLGNRFERYQREKPDWLSAADLARADQAQQVAGKYDLPLSTLAHRYVLSIQEIDYVVIGPRTMGHLTQTLADCQQGPLPEELFDELTNRIL